MYQENFYDMDLFIPLETIDPSTTVMDYPQYNPMFMNNAVTASPLMETYSLLKENTLDFIGFDHFDLSNVTDTHSKIFYESHFYSDEEQKSLSLSIGQGESEEEEEESDPDWIQKDKYSISKPPKTMDTIQCSNCSTTNTPLWRRSSQGNSLCNACGLFLKLHGVVRPLSLKTDVIKKRNRGSKHKKSSIKKKRSKGSTSWGQKQ